MVLLIVTSVVVSCSKEVIKTQHKRRNRKKWKQSQENTNKNDKEEVIQILTQK